MQKQRFFPNNLRLESSGPASNRERCQHPDAFFFRKEMTKRKSGLYMLLFLIFLSALSAYLPAASSTNTRWDLQRAGRCRSTRGALRTCHFCRLGSSGDAVHTQIPAGLRADSEPFPSFPRGRSVWEPPQLRRLCPLFRVVLCPARPMRGGCLSCQARCQTGRGSGSKKPLCFIVRVGEEGLFLQPCALCPSPPHLQETSCTPVRGETVGLWQPLESIVK